MECSAIREALERGEFEFHYQPKVEFLTGTVSGAEALIRWRRADGEVVSASRFIPEAQSCGLVPLLTERMFPRLMEDQQRLRAAGVNPHIALNISADDLDAPHLLHLIRDAIGQHHLDSTELELEITEGAAVSDNQASRRTLTGLVAAGISLSMDDYGTGFSSLETLDRLPFSAIKLDQRFVFRMLRSPKTTALIKTSVAAANMLGIKMVVEGIETEQAYRALARLGCSDGQGYWISPALPLDDYLALLASGRRWPCSALGPLRLAALTHQWHYTLLLDQLAAALHPDPATDPLSALAHVHEEGEQCALGRWYVGPGLALAGDPDYDALDAPHREMHDLCGVLLSDVQGGFGPAQLAPVLTRLGESALQVAAHLERLERRLMLEELTALHGGEPR